MDAKSRLLNATKELLKSYGYFVDNLWHVDDVHFLCEQHNVAKLTNEEAMVIFYIAHEQIENEDGITWPKLEKALHTYLQRRALIAREKNSA